uniref:Uncharacterized protein n=1 Tax=Arundo donax TaxID=35708 RepID=A0A0A9ECF8_ARUDO
MYCLFTGSALFSQLFFSRNKLQLCCK